MMKYHLVYTKGRYYPVLGDIDAGTESIDQAYTDQTPEPAELQLEVPRVHETSNSIESDTRNPFTSPTRPIKRFRPFSTKLYNEILQSKYPVSSRCGPLEVCEETKYKLPISEQYHPDGEKTDRLQIDERIDKSQMRDGGEVGNETVKSVDIKEENENIGSNLHSAAKNIVTDSIEKAVLVAEEIIKEIDTEMKEKETITTRKPPENKIESAILNEKHLPVRESVKYYETIAKTEINDEKTEDDRKLFLIQEIKETIDTGYVKNKSIIFEKKDGAYRDVREETQSIVKDFAHKMAYLRGQQMVTHLKNLSVSPHCRPLLRIFLIYLANVLVAFSRFIPKPAICNNKQREQDINRHYTNCDIYHEDTTISDKSVRGRKLSSSEIAQIVSRIPVDVAQKMDTVITEFHEKLNIDVHHDAERIRSKSCSRIEEARSTSPFKWVSMSSEERERVKNDIKLATLAAARRVLQNRKTSFQSYDNAECIIPLNTLMYIAIVESHVYTNRNAIFNDYSSRVKVDAAIAREITNYNKAEAIKTELSITSKTFNDSIQNGDVRNRKAFENVESSDNLRINTNELRTDYVATVTVQHKQVPRNVQEHDESEIEVKNDSVIELTQNLPVNIEVASNEITKTLTDLDNCRIITSALFAEDKIYVGQMEQTSDEFNAVLDRVTISDVQEQPKISVETKELTANVFGKEILTCADLEETCEENTSSFIGAVKCDVQELSTATIFGKETLRQNRADFIQADIKDYENDQRLVKNAIDKDLDDHFCKSLRVCIPIYQDLMVLIEEVTTIDEVVDESAVINEEIKEFISVPATVITLCLLEECNVLKIEEVREESMESLEPSVFSTAFAIALSYLEGIDIMYDESQNFTIEDIEKEQAVTSEVENIFVTALAVCVALIIAIEALEESEDFVVDEVNEESASQLEPVLINATPISTPSYTQINTTVHETLDIVAEEFAEELAASSEEENVFVKTIAMCCDVYSLADFKVEDCIDLNHDQFEDQFAVYTEEQVFASALPTCTSVYNQINVILFEAQSLVTDYGAERAEVYEEVDILMKPSVMCTGVNQDRKLDLEECDDLEIEVISEQHISVSEEPSVLASTLAFCTSVNKVININYEEEKTLEIEVVQKENLEITEEVNNFVLAFGVCVAINKDIYTDLEETNTFTADITNAETVPATEEPQIFTSTLPSGVSVMREINTSYSIPDLFTIDLQEDKADTSGVESYLMITVPRCVDVIRTSKVSLEEVKCFEVDRIEEETVVTALEPQVYFKSLPTCTPITTYFNLITFEVTHKEVEVVERGTASLLTETADLDRTLSICRATVKWVDEAFTEIKTTSITFDVDNQYVNVVVEPDHFVSPKQLRIDNTIKTYKEIRLTNEDSNLEVEADEMETEIAVKAAAADAMNVNLVSIDDNVTISSAVESAAEIHQEGLHIAKKEQNVNLRSEQQLIEAGVQEESRNLLQKHSKVILNETAAAKTYQDVTGKVSLTKHEIISESTEDTLLLERKSDLEVLHVDEEFQETIGIEIENLENEPDVVIEEITDEEAIQKIKYAEDIASKTSQDIEDLEVIHLKEQRHKASGAAAEESAALTITKTEELEIINPLEVEVEDLTFTNITEIRTISGSAQERSKSGSKSSSKTTKRSTLSNINTEVVSQHLADEISSTTKGTSLRKSAMNYDSTAFREDASSSFISSSSMVAKTGYTIVRTAADEVCGVQSPPTPLIDEYIFRLTAPLPKSRSATPIPRDPTPEIHQPSTEEDQRILVPSIETVAVERVVYSPPLPTPPTPPTTPAYTKPGLNGGARPLPRFIRPGLRGGSDRPPVTKEEISELLKYTSRLTSAITETLRNIEEYKKEVGILKEAYDPEDKMEADEPTKDTANKPEADDEHENLDDETVTIAEAVVDENVDDGENDSITVDSPSEANTEVAKGFVPTEDIIEEVNERIDNQEVKEAADKDDAAADQEVARVTGGSGTERRQETFEETTTLKEARVISLTRVLSAHMLREGLSPDCQMKTQYDNQVMEDEEMNREVMGDRSLSTFMQKTGPEKKLENITDLKNFGGSMPSTPGQPVPPEAALASGEEPEFFVAVPQESGLVTILPLAAAHRTPDLGVMGDSGREIGGVAEDGVNAIVKQALKVAEGDGALEAADSSVGELVRSRLKASSSRTLESDAHELVGDQNFQEVATQNKEYTAPKSDEVSTDYTEQAQNIKEKKITSTDKMLAETKGGLEVVEGQDKYRKEHQRTRVRPQPKFGRLNPEPRSLVLPGGRRWRRPGEEISEESIADAILAQSEIILGKTLGINFMKYEKPPPPLDHLQRSEVYKLVHNVEQAPPKRVELLGRAIAAADYREKCRAMSPNQLEVSSGQLQL